MKDSDIYSALDATSEEDILLHFPKRYDDMATTDLNAPFTDGQKIVVFGSISTVAYLQGGRIIRLTAHSDNYNQDVSCMIFGQPFYMRVLSKAKKYFFLGSYREKSKVCMLSSVISSDSILVANRYKPYYALPSKVSQLSFYKLVLNIINNRNEYISDVLPKKYIEKYQLEDRLTAFKDVHIPTSYANVKRGLRVFKYEEALKYCLVSLYDKKNSSLIKKNNSIKIRKEDINKFILNLKFKLTKDQVESVREIVLDMDSETVMNRLLQGDVGTGKTIVAFISIYANYLRCGQSIMLAPTVTLAQQHFSRAKEVFKNYPLRIAELDNSLTSKEQKAVIKGLEDGTIDCVIGTQGVFSESVKYKNLTLAIADEQHKFGVEQRKKLLGKGTGVDLLSMSATPIPRTLSMIINSDINVSFLNEFPSKQREVLTKRISSLDPIIDKAITHALDVHKQVFIVTPKIEENEKSERLSSKAVYEQIVSKYGEDNVALLTGKVKKDEQEKIYSDFSKGKKLILVSTSLIEVGVDVQNAALMVIYEANYFGLASLHQLRGRIGRSGEGAMALLVYDGDDKEAIDKLDYLSTHDNGEDIAMFDLLHRGSGDLLSERQSGASILQVANFVSDHKIFECAKEDAAFILGHQSDSNNSSYLDYILSGQSIK